MTPTDKSEFVVIERGESIQTTEKRPYGREHTTLVYCFECPVVIRRYLECQQCGQEFSYDLDVVLHWEKGYRHETSEQEALERVFAREHQRTSTPDHDAAVVCPHCGATQGAREKLPKGLAGVIKRLRRQVAP